MIAETSEVLPGVLKIVKLAVGICDAKDLIFDAEGGLYESGELLRTFAGVGLNLHDLIVQAEGEFVHYYYNSSNHFKIKFWFRYFINMKF